jgi:hypothetical protein
MYDHKSANRIKPRMIEVKGNPVHRPKKSNMSGTVILRRFNVVHMDVAGISEKKAANLRCYDQSIFILLLYVG